LIVQHGDGTCRSWTLEAIEPSPGGSRLLVREEPGFEIDAHTREARYYQFPGVISPVRIDFAWSILHVHQGVKKLTRKIWKD